MLCSLLPTLLSGPQSGPLHSPPGLLGQLQQVQLLPHRCAQRWAVGGAAQEMLWKNYRRGQLLVVQGLQPVF
jgi:hypothetical protein